ncbi:MAG: ATP-binding protein, partial [Gammaproteobacteria bacterium]|nr:ATP-binding protein [Gammaproteobacteria bacterium]
MPQESQNVEWKRSWRDEYLKWICGFANAQGGVLEIGRDDKGKVVGVSGVLRLLEEIPNKALSVLGILVDVNLKSEDGKEYLEIAVGGYPNPVSYKGGIYYR